MTEFNPDDFEARMARMDRFAGRVTDAIDAVSAVLDDPELTDYEPRRAALLEARKWLESEVTCGDCIEGRCHWGGERSTKSIAEAKAGREYLDSRYGPCGCDRHEASVQARRRQQKEAARG